MRNTALNYLRQLGSDSTTRLTAHFATEVEEMSILASRAMEALQNYHRFNLQHDPNNPRQVAFGLMSKGVNTLMAAFQLALSGYRWEPSILLRSALEGFSTAWDLVHNPARFEQWKTSRKFESTHSISAAKEAIGEIGKLYGHLSTINVHTSPLNSSPSMVLVDGEPKFQFFGLVSPGKEAIRNTEIYLTLFASYICLQLTELVFHQYAIELETIEIDLEKNLARTKVSQRHRTIVDAMEVHFARIAVDPNTSL
ncbi:MAG: hypothetical protein QM750_30635 [Rubrivivax sp.]